MLTRKIRSPARIPAAFWSVCKSQDELSCSALDTVRAHNNICSQYCTILECDAGPRIPIVTFSKSYNLISHLNLNTGISNTSQESFVVVSPVAYVPGHIHQRLLGQDLAIVPPADLHIR